MRKNNLTGRKGATIAKFYGIIAITPGYNLDGVILDTELMLEMELGGGWSGKGMNGKEGNH